MGRGKQQKPERIAQKLKDIRLSLGYTQDEMAKALNSYGLNIYRGYVGAYEIGKNYPSLLVTLAYARIAKIPMEVLVDDELDLP